MDVSSLSLNSHIGCRHRGHTHGQRCLLALRHDTLREDQRTRGPGGARNPGRRRQGEYHQGAVTDSKGCVIARVSHETNRTYNTFVQG